MTADQNSNANDNTDYMSGAYVDGSTLFFVDGAYVTGTTLVVTA